MSRCPSGERTPNSFILTVTAPDLCDNGATIARRRPAAFRAGAPTLCLISGSEQHARTISAERLRRSESESAVCAGYQGNGHVHCFLPIVRTP